MALDKLQAKIAKYAFPSVFADFLYFNGPAKSMPTTSKTVPASVLSFGSSPGTGAGAALKRNLLQPQHSLRTFFTNPLRRETQ
jgi:hypothetical protein